ncbi:MAG: hypothetical protein A2Y20_10515 [Firmicutes bacterium GWF2_51_9]|nr:GNAT family N-acetyltransferase [Erysipelotrichaceae bacterium]OGS53041.1 MAG: hypothetical protein A2Y20_10515 [Firmicutes bacterium GWF2_51_9]OGS59483.1 MAG: hypothetical protein A2Y19_10900 [Firmicutes bacterium GWE2_51_13]
MKTLETSRLILRGFSESDLEDTYAYCVDPEVGPNAGWMPHKNKEETLTIIHHFMLNEEVWAIVEKESMKVIGSVGLHADRKRSTPDVKMIGYVLAKPTWGQGYAVEVVKGVLEYAFEEMKLKMVTVYHYPFNTRSRRVIEKTGFHYEGMLRYSSKLPDGRITDDVCYSMDVDEYYHLRESKG